MFFPRRRISSFSCIQYTSVTCVISCKIPVKLCMYVRGAWYQCIIMTVLTLFSVDAVVCWSCYLLKLLCVEAIVCWSCCLLKLLSIEVVVSWSWCCLVRVVLWPLPWCVFTAHVVDVLSGVGINLWKSYQSNSQDFEGCNPHYYKWTDKLHR